MQQKTHSYFKFLDWKLDTVNHQLFLNYDIEKIGKVTEVLSFPKFDLRDDKEFNSQVFSACELIHLMCGVSYYKSGLAKHIRFEHNQPSEPLRHFIEKTWKHGLAELAYENNVLLNYFKIINTDEDNEINTLIPMNSNDFIPLTPVKSLVAIGGGKDSLVTIEELRQQEHDITLFMVGGSALIKQVAAFTNLPLIQIQRKIDPKLIEYNHTEKGFNGHVPITAINSCVSVLTALLFDFNEIVFSNERSADSANTINDEGDLVNHQYSKSLEFEQDISAVISREITPNIRYYSQQRAYSELAILEKFSHYPQYFPVFSSCNRNFHIDGSHNTNSKWCCDCPKCRFVFLGLAPFIEKNELLAIFKINMLDDHKQMLGFEELLGLKGFKPFECVGEIQESQLAFNLIKNKTEWQNDKLVVEFSQKIAESTEQQYQQIMHAKEV